MNERIKELAIQVQRTEMPGVLFAHPEFVEKFTGLIVRNIIEELESSKKGDIYTGDLFDCEWNDCIDAQIAMLKEHFGVK